MEDRDSSHRIMRKILQLCVTGAESALKPPEKIVLTISRTLLQPAYFRDHHFKLQVLYKDYFPHSSMLMIRPKASGDYVSPRREYQQDLY